MPNDYCGDHLDSARNVSLLVPHKLQTHVNSSVQLNETTAIMDLVIHNYKHAIESCKFENMPKTGGYIVVNFGVV